MGKVSVQGRHLVLFDGILETGESGCMLGGLRVCSEGEYVLSKDKVGILGELRICTHGERVNLSVDWFEGQTVRAAMRGEICLVLQAQVDAHLLAELSPMRRHGGLQTSHQTCQGCASNGHSVHSGPSPYLHGHINTIFTYIFNLEVSRLDYYSDMQVNPAAVVVDCQVGVTMAEARQQCPHAARNLSLGTTQPNSKHTSVYHPLIVLDDNPMPYIPPPLIVWLERKQ